MNKATQKAGRAAAGTIGRELGKTAFGKFGKQAAKIGGNAGSQFMRGLFDTFTKG